MMPLNTKLTKKGKDDKKKGSMINHGATPTEQKKGS